VVRRGQLVVVRAAAAALVTLGAALTALSAFYVSSFLAILGLALVFWGCILVYVAPTRQVPYELLEAAADVNAGGIERVLSELGVSGRGVYLPPKNLRDIESSLVFIPFASAAELQVPPEIPSEMPAEIVPPPSEVSLGPAPEVAVEPVPEPEPGVAAEAVEPVPEVPVVAAEAVPERLVRVAGPELDLARLVEEALADLESIGAAALKELEEL